jgi:hypothetical protein
MARIPTGQGEVAVGGQVAEPQRASALDLRAWGVGIAQQAERGAAAAVQRLQQIEAQQEAARQDAAEREARLRAVESTSAARVALHDLTDRMQRGVLTGEIDRDTTLQQFDEEAGAVVSEQVRRLEEIDANAARQLQAGLAELRANARGRVNEAVIRRTQGDVRSGLMQSTETYERLAASEPERALREFSILLDAMGPQAGLAPPEVQSLRQGFRERVAFNRASAMIRASRDSLPDLDAAMQAISGEQFADLDPGRRGQLEQQIVVRRQQVLHKEQLAAQRAALAAERRQREAAGAFDAITSLIDRGGLPNDATTHAAIAKVQGTPYQQPLQQLLAQGASRAGFASLPPAQQVATLDTLRARASTEGTSPEMEKRIATLSGIAERTRKDIDEDPLRAAFARRQIDGELAPLNVADLGTLSQQLAERRVQAQQASVWSGRPVSPLTKDEAQQLGQMIDAMPVQQRARALGAIAGAIPDPQQRQALAAQVAQDKQPIGLALAAASSMTNRGRSVSELILKGHDADKSGVLKDKPRNVNDLALIAREIDGVQWSSQQARDAALRATTLIYRALQADGSPNAQQAILLGVGGISEVNGAKVTRPWGWDESDFSAAVARGSNAATLAAMNDGAEQVLINGQPVALSTLARQWRDVQLRNYGDGAYAVIAGGGVVMRSNGQPFLYRVQ